MMSNLCAVAADLCAISYVHNVLLVYQVLERLCVCVCVCVRTRTAACQAFAVTRTRRVVQR